jgi:hypothetical protein
LIVLLLLSDSGVFQHEEDDHVLQVAHAGIGDVLRCHKSTAAGIITELADAAVAPKWKEAMMKHMKEKNTVHSDVFDFGSMGDNPRHNEGDQTVGVTPFGDPARAKRVTAFAEKIHDTCKNKPQVHLRASTRDSKHNYKPSSSDFLHKAECAEHLDFSSCMEEIELKWTWGMKFLFQRFTIRRSSKKLNEFLLWPFMQPKVNNRDMEVPMLWKPTDSIDREEKFVNKIFESNVAGWDVQGACSTPLSVRISRPDGPGSAHPESMVSGVDSSVNASEGNDDLVFRNLAMWRSTLEEMDKCYKAIVARCLDFCCMLDFVSFFRSSPLFPRLNRALTGKNTARLSKRMISFSK